MNEVQELRQAIRDFVKKNDEAFPFLQGTVTDVDEKEKECTVLVSLGNAKVSFTEVSFNHITPKKGSAATIVSLAPDYADLHLIDQKIADAISKTENYDNKIDLTAPNINLNADVVKLGKLKEVLLGLVDLNLEMIKTQATAAPALLDKTLILKFETIKNQLDQQMK